MGGSQSTRKLSVENENAIQVSQEAISRIQAQLANRTADPLPTTPQPQYTPPPVYDNKRPDFAAEEAYWTRRINTLKLVHENINNEMREEYEKKLKEADTLFNSIKNDKSINRLPPCQEEKKKVLECYSVNPDKSLLCSMLVNQFNDCVCKSRVSSISGS